MLFNQDLSSLATQPVQGKGGNSCEDGAGRTRDEENVTGCKDEGGVE